MLRDFTGCHTLHPSDIAVVIIMDSQETGNTSGPLPTEERDEIRRTGISASPGIVVGTAFLKHAELLAVPRSLVPATEVDQEVQAFHQALADTRAQLLGIKSDLAERMGDDHARIFDAHLLILDDEMITNGTANVIREKRLNAPAAFEEVIDRVIDTFGQMEDEYLKARYVDVKDVKRRIIRNLLGRTRLSARPTEPSVIVAHDLSPSETAQLDRRFAIAYATDLGGRTSHTAILARSQGVPAVVGLDGLFSEVRSGETVIIDGNTGTVVVNPTRETLEEYEHVIRRFRELEEQLLTLTGYPATTLDDHDFGLMANLDLPEEVDSVLEYGGQGVGLFRTEYFFISHDYLPSEEEQFEMYREVARKLGDKPVVFRTLDIGGDKIVDYLHSSAELNPFMGWRGIRFCLTRQDIFKTQLRALYRASAFGRMKIMFPMISQIEELIQAKKICAEVRADLEREGQEFDATVELGIMVETPAAVAMADHLAKEAQFFSVGTNDLIQYTLAVDRGNSKIAHLYQNLHPSIIRFLKQTVDAAHKRNIPVSVCGEMCGDPLSVPILIGLQIDEFSLSPNMIPEVKRIIRAVTFDECRALCRRVMRYRTTDEIKREITKFLETRLSNNGHESPK